jgi:hypothetical protein
VALIRIDYPDEVIHWFASYPESERRRPALGRCPHACAHLQTATVGWGPDAAHYELIRCDGQAERGPGCDGHCRGWLPAPGTHAQHLAVEWHLLGPAYLAGR